MIISLNVPCNAVLAQSVDFLPEIDAPDTAPTNRMETVLTLHFPLKAGFLIADRNRADLDWKDGTFDWRYRNKLTIERTFAVFSYHFIPYIAAEPYYTSQYGTWSATALYAGCLFPAGSMCNVILITSMRTTPGKLQMNSATRSGLLAVSIFRWKRSN